LIAAFTSTRGIDVEAVLAHHHGRGNAFALLARQAPVRHRRQPHIGVEAELVRSVTRHHRPAARLREIADEDAVPARDLRGLGRESLEHRNEFRVPPVAIARETHRLPVLAVDRERDCTREAALGVEPDRACAHGRGVAHLAEQGLGDLVRPRPGFLRGLLRRGGGRGCRERGPRLR
jgi:hypothetical protein